MTRSETIKAFFIKSVLPVTEALWRIIPNYLPFELSATPSA